MKKNYRRPLPATLLTAIVLLLLLNKALGQKTGQPLIDSLVSRLPFYGEDTAKANLLSRIAQQYRQLGKKEEADYLHRQLALSTQLNYPFGMASANLQLGAICTARREFEKGLAYLQESARQFHEIKSSANEATVYNNIAKNYQDQEKLPLAEQAYRKAVAIDQKGKRLRAAARSNANLGGALFLLGRYDEALDTLMSALNKLDTARDKPNIAVACDNIGSIHYNKGNYVAAYEYHLRSLRLREQMGTVPALAQTILNIAQNFQARGDYRKAIEYCQQALKIYQDLKDIKQVGRVYHQLSLSYSDLGDEKNQVRCLSESLAIAKETGDTRALAAVATSFGSYYKGKSNFRLAAVHYEEALARNTALANQRGKVVSLINLGSLYRDSPDSSFHLKKRVRWARAQGLLQEALQLAKSLNDREMEKNTWEHISYLYAVQGNFEKAYTTRIQAMDLKDSLLNDENTKTITRKEIQYEYSRKEDSLKYAQQLIAEKLKQQTLLTEQEKLRAEQQTLLANEKSLLAQQQTLLADKRQQDLALKQANLDLLTKENLLQRLAVEKTEAELSAEQSQREEKEKQLLIAGQEKTIQQNQLALRNAELSAKDNELAGQRRVRNLSIAGFALLLLSLFFIFRNYRNKQKAKENLAAERLKTQKAEAVRRMAEFEMHGLRAQLNPHFMFNSLNAIQEQILKEQNDTASDYLTSFARMLRQLLENAEQPFVPLSKELDFLKHYLNMERLRMPDLHYDVQMPPAINADAVMIPNMILQPYLENAIWHGLSPKSGDKRIRIKVDEEAEGITVRIFDNGIGRQKAAELKSRYRKTHQSKGMELLQKRFELMRTEFGSAIKINIEDLRKNGEAAGTQVSLHIPSTLAQSRELLRETVANN